MAVDAQPPARRPPRVLILTSSFPATGSDSTAAFMREYVSALGLPGRVLVPEPPGGQRLGRVGECEIEAVRYWRGSGPRLAHGHGIPGNLRAHPWTALQVPALLWATATRALTRASEADVIVAHWAVPGGLVGSWTSARTGLPLVTVLHSGGVHALRRMLGGARIAERIAAGSDALVATSPYIRDRFLELLRASKRAAAAARTKVVPMGMVPPKGVEHAFEHRSRSEPARVLYLGRLAPVKGVDTLIEAMTRVQSAQLDVVGFGPERASLERQATRSGAAVSFHGAIQGDAKQRWFQQASVVALPSRMLENGRTESLPVVLLEALAHGRPVVASAVGGVATLLAGTGAGILVPPDDPDALARALNDLLRQPRLASAMGRAARRLAKGFTWEALGPPHQAIVRSVAARRWPILHSDPNSLESGLVPCGAGCHAPPHQGLATVPRTGRVGFF